MKRMAVLRLFGAAVSLLVLGSCLIWFVYRPWALNWGATDHEIARVMPGDSIISDATFNATRAVTVNTGPEHIWPWLVQIGYRRAGLYSYDLLDNDGIPSAEQILPEFQDLRAGDSIPIGPGFYVKVGYLEQNRLMLLEFPDWAEATWVLGLYPDGPNRTRLVTRLRGRPLGRTRIFVDLGEIFPMRKSMLGIKRRAETLARQQGAARGDLLFRSSPFGMSLRANVLVCHLRSAWRSIVAEKTTSGRTMAMPDKTLPKTTHPS